VVSEVVEVEKVLSVEAMAGAPVMVEPSLSVAVAASPVVMRDAVPKVRVVAPVVSYSVSSLSSSSSSVLWACCADKLLEAAACAEELAIISLFRDSRIADIWLIAGGGGSNLGINGWSMLSRWGWQEFCVRETA